MNRRPNGFTLVELIMVIAIIGILAVVALPKFQDLSQSAKIASTKGTLGALRSVLAIEYAKSATGGAAASYPASVSGTNFADEQEPTNSLSGNTGVTTTTGVPGGTVTNARGFWYIQSNGRAGAFSDGTVDTSTF